MRSEKREGQRGFPLSVHDLGEILMYPRPSEIKGICALLDLFRIAQITQLRRAQELDRAVVEILGDPGGEEIWSECGLDDFHRGDQVFLEGRTPHFETSSLVYVRSAMVFSAQIEGVIADCLTGAEEEVITGFWKGARQLTDPEYPVLSRLASRPPRYEIDVPDLEEKLRASARRLGLLEEDEDLVP